MRTQAPRYFLAALLTMLAVASAAQAREPEHRRWEASVVGGASFLGGTSGAGPGVTYADGYLAGVRVTDNHWRHLGFTLGYTYANHPLTLRGLLDRSASVGMRHAVHRVAYDLVFYPMDESHRLRPYGFAGPGVAVFWMRDKPAGLTNPVSFEFDFGVGAKYLVADHFAFGVEYRDAVSGTPRYALPNFNPQGVMHNSQITVAFHYQF